MNVRNDTNKPTTYRIRVQGVLDAKWTSWFEGFTIEEIEGDTLLTGLFIDQAALRGALNKLWDLNLNLISIHLVPYNKVDCSSTGG
jgi:hypothetical protein